MTVPRQGEISLDQSTFKKEKERLAYLLDAALDVKQWRKVQGRSEPVAGRWTS